jgi:hypothetical protein
MSQRGRGCLSIAPSDNAFYQTTTGEIGLRPNAHPGSTFRRPFTESSSAAAESAAEGSVTAVDAGAATGNFSFLYTRESDKIGAMVRKGNNMQMTHTLPRKPSFGTRFMESGLTQVPPKPSAEELLSYYRQGTKEEDPRYTTSTVRVPAGRGVCGSYDAALFSPSPDFVPCTTLARAE